MAQIGKGCEAFDIKGISEGALDGGWKPGPQEKESDFIVAGWVHR